MFYQMCLELVGKREMIGKGQGRPTGNGFSLNKVYKFAHNRSGYWIIVECLITVCKLAKKLVRNPKNIHLDLLIKQRKRDTHQFTTTLGSLPFETSSKYWTALP
jgi:hypothetical protein